MVQKKAVAVVCVKFTADGTFLLSGDVDGQINVWDATNGKLIRFVNVCC